MTQPTVSKHWRRVVSNPGSYHHVTMLQYACTHNKIQNTSKTK